MLNCNIMGRAFLTIYILIFLIQHGVNVFEFVHLMFMVHLGSPSGPATSDNSQSERCEEAPSVRGA